MNLLFAIIAGILFGCGVYMMLRRSIMRLVMGLVLIGHAANIVIFTAGGLERARPAIIPDGGEILPHGATDPLPQALILTAIVISFGVVAFALALISRVWIVAGADDTSAFSEQEP